MTTRINQPSKPTKTDFENCKVLVVSFGNWNNEAKLTWYLPDRFRKEFSEHFEEVATIEIAKNFYLEDKEIKGSFSAVWQHIYESASAQFEFESENGKTKSFPLSDLIKKKRWWEF